MGIFQNIRDNYLIRNAFRLGTATAAVMTAEQLLIPETAFGQGVTSNYREAIQELSDKCTLFQEDAAFKNSDAWKDFVEKFPDVAEAVENAHAKHQSNGFAQRRTLSTQIRWSADDFMSIVTEEMKRKPVTREVSSPSNGNGGVGVAPALSPEEQARQQNEIDFNKLVTLEYRIKTYDIAQDSEFRSRLKAKYRKERFKDDVAGVMRDGLDLAKTWGTGVLADIIGGKTGEDIRRSGQNSQARHNQQETQRDFNDTSAEFQEIMAAIGAGTYDARHWQDKKFTLIEQRDVLIDALSERGVDVQTIKKLQENGQKLAKRDVEALELKQGKAAPSQTNTPDEKTKESSASDQNKIKALEQKKKAVQTELNDFFDSFDGIEIDSLKGNKLEKFEKGVLKDFDRLSPEAQDAINTIFREEESNGAKRTDKRKVKLIMDARDTNDNIRQDILDAVKINGLGAIQKSSEKSSTVASIEGGGGFELEDFGRKLSKKEAIAVLDRMGVERKGVHFEKMNADYLNSMVQFELERRAQDGQPTDLASLIKPSKGNSYVASVNAGREAQQGAGISV